MDVDIVLFDNKQQPIGVNKTEVRTLMAGQERYFRVLWFQKIDTDVSSVDVVAETDVFLNDNFMKRYGTPEEFKKVGN